MESDEVYFHSVKNKTEYAIFNHVAFLDSDVGFKKILKYVQFENRFRWFSSLLSFTAELKIKLIENKNSGPTPAQRVYIYLSCMSPVDGRYPFFNIHETEEVAKNFPEMSKIDDEEMYSVH